MTETMHSTSESDRLGLCRARSADWLQAIVEFLNRTETHGVDCRDFRINGKTIRLKAERHHSLRKIGLRTLIDSWFAYHVGCHGLLKSTFTVQWLNRGDLRHARIQAGLQALTQSPFVSISNAALQVFRGEISSDLMKDHAVPVKVIEAELSGLPAYTPATVEALLLRRYRLGIITKNENLRFRQPQHRLDLTCTMPPDADPTDAYARYKHPLVAITFHPAEPRGQVSPCPQPTV